jgi:lipopolysaccharide export system protein LptA
MTSRSCTCILVIALAAASGAAAVARQDRAPGISLDAYTITADQFEGVLGGPGEWSGNVTIAGADAKATCDSLKVWPAADGKEILRARAKGNIAIRGRYLAADKTEWRIVGKADSAAYERESGQGTLEGSVTFEATNASTGAAVTVAADRLTYDVKTRRFRFEGVQQPVRGQWREPAGEAEAQAAAEPSEGEQPESEP